MQDKILILYHCDAGTGYAIEKLEPVFWEMAMNLTGGESANIFLSYRDYPHGFPTYVPGGFKNFYTFFTREQNREKLKDFAEYVRSNQITVVFGFDQPVHLPYYRFVRKAGVRRIISYWGAPMSSINKGLKLWLKKLEVALYRWSPELYIFESEAMRLTATQGRGIPEDRTALCHLGVDTEKYKPYPEDKHYAHELFNIPREQKLIFYSGHFEPRKGISVIMKAANMLAEKRDDLTFVLFGNKEGQEDSYASMLTGAAREKVVFGGYRDDLNRIHRSCYAGVIASIGWDSFTVSSLEMQASGLPLLVSDLPGLRESISDGQTGFLFPPGGHRRLGELLIQLSDSPAQQKIHSKAARQRAVLRFSINSQISKLTKLLQANLADRPRAIP